MSHVNKAQTNCQEEWLGEQAVIWRHKKGFGHNTRPRGLIYLFLIRDRDVADNVVVEEKEIPWGKSEGLMFSWVKVWSASGYLHFCCRWRKEHQELNITADLGKVPDTMSISKHRPSTSSWVSPGKMRCEFLRFCQVTYICQFNLKNFLLIHPSSRVIFWTVKSFFSRRMSASTSLLAVYINFPDVGSCNEVCFLPVCFSFLGSHRPETHALSVFHPGSSHSFSHKDAVQELIPDKAPCFSRDTFPRISQTSFYVMKAFTFSFRGWSAHCFPCQEHFSATQSTYLDTTFCHNSRLLMDCDLSCPDVCGPLPRRHPHTWPPYILNFVGLTLNCTSSSDVHAWPAKV